MCVSVHTPARMLSFHRPNSSSTLLMKSSTVMQSLGEASRGQNSPIHGHAPKHSRTQSCREAQNQATKQFHHTHTHMYIFMYIHTYMHIFAHVHTCVPKRIQQTPVCHIFITTGIGICASTYKQELGSSTGTKLDTHTRSEIYLLSTPPHQVCKHKYNCMRTDIFSPSVKHIKLRHTKRRDRTKTDLNPPHLAL